MPFGGCLHKYLTITTLLSPRFSWRSSSKLGSSQNFLNFQAPGHPAKPFVTPRVSIEPHLRPSFTHCRGHMLLRGQPAGGLFCTLTFSVVSGWGCGDVAAFYFLLGLAHLTQVLLLQPVGHGRTLGGHSRRLRDRRRFRKECVIKESEHLLIIRKRLIRFSSFSNWIFELVLIAFIF